MISLNETKREAYRSRRLYLLDEQTRRWEARDEGRQVGRIQLLESLLGQSETPLEQLAQRSRDELQELEVELRRQLASRS